jgi:hypothetical protein
MLQVARLAPSLLEDAAPRVADFLAAEWNEDGGARDRDGKSDLYYTAFALDAQLALQAERPLERCRDFLASFGDGGALDFVHRACLTRAWASLGDAPPEQGVARWLADAEANRSADGGYAAFPNQPHGTLYNAFLTVGMYQDVGLPVPDAEALVASFERLRTPDGGYANSLDLPLGTTPATAAAVALQRQLGAPSPAEVGPWLLAQLHPQGGFKAMPEAPLPDLVSTATALHALAGLEQPLGLARELLLDFLDSLWTGTAFCGQWDDDALDVEYTFYALLSLGHLSLDA